MNNIYQILLTKSHKQLIQIDKDLGGVVHSEYLECEDVLSQILADILVDMSKYQKIDITKYLN
jgi:hypothetical protein